MNIRQGLTGLGAAVLLASPALAVSQANLAAGYSMASSCSGINFGSFSQDGTEIGTTSATRTCNTATSATAGAGTSAASSASGTVNGYGYANQSNSTATIGTLHLYAESFGSAATALSGSQAMAGWNDTMTITGGTGAGVWIYSLEIDGMLTATGHGADTQFGIEMFKNHLSVQPYGSAANAAAFGVYQALNAPLNADGMVSSWDSELTNIRLTDYTGPKSFAAVDRTVYFAIPFTYGTAFSFGVYAQVAAGEASAGAFGGNNAAVADFAHTITWAGKGYVAAADGTGKSTDFLLSSASGFDYNIAAGVPEPTSWMTMLAGFGLAGTAMRRRPRRVAG